jgi:hypothetical protein
MVNLCSEVEGQGAGEQARTLCGIVCIPESLITIKIGLIQFFMVLPV